MMADWIGRVSRLFGSMRRAGGVAAMLALFVLAAVLVATALVRDRIALAEMP